MGRRRDEEEECASCPAWAYRLGEWCMKGFVLFLVWLPSISSALLIFWPMSNVLLSSLCSAFLLWTAYATTRFYLLACHTEAGFAAEDGSWEPSAEELRVLQSIVGPKSWKRIKEERVAAYCRKCQIHRPLRSHHSSETGRCVLGQDHYCPFVCNNVGFHNRKHFVSFLFWATTGLVFVLLTSGVRGMYAAIQQETLHPLELVAVLINVILAFALGIGVGSLLGYQVWAIWRNTNTIEHYDYDRRKAWARKHKRPFIYPWDLGARRNFAVYFGRTWAQWLSFEASPARGMGFHEDISSAFLRSLDAGETHWHIRQKEEV